MTGTIFKLMRLSRVDNFFSKELKSLNIPVSVQQHADSTVAIKDEAPDSDTGDPLGAKMDDSPPPPPPPTTTVQPKCDSLDDFMGRQVKRLMREEDAAGISSRLPLLPLPRHEVMTAEATARLRQQQGAALRQKQQPTPAAVIVLRCKQGQDSDGARSSITSSDGVSPRTDVDEEDPVGGGLSDSFDGLENGFDDPALLQHSMDDLMECDDDEDEDDDIADESDEDCSDILYRCDLCSQRFQLLDFLKHQEVHKDDFPYQCPNSPCSRKFKTQSEMRAHRRVSHKSASPQVQDSTDVMSRFVCPHCKKGFDLLAGLKDHLVTEHLHGRAQNQQHHGNLQHQQTPSSNAATSATMANSALRPPTGISSTSTTSKSPHQVFHSDSVA